MRRQSQLASKCIKGTENINRSIHDQIPPYSSMYHDDWSPFIVIENAERDETTYEEQSPLVSGD